MRCRQLFARQSSTALDDLQRYPDGACFELRTALADQLGVPLPESDARQRVERCAGAAGRGFPDAGGQRGLRSVFVRGVPAGRAGDGRDGAGGSVQTA